LLVLGTELIDWLLLAGWVICRAHAISVGQLLLSKALLSSCSSGTQFIDGAECYQLAKYLLSSLLFLLVSHFIDMFPCCYSTFSLFLVLMEMLQGRSCASQAMTGWFISKKSCLPRARRLLPVADLADLLRCFGH
jgi:hypothetical protein